MPKLPDATNLNGVNIGAPRSMVDIPVPDYAGAANAVARGVSDLGQGVTDFASARLERAKKQERFDTKMGLIKAEEAYAEQVRDLDPLDPDYVEKKRKARRDTFAPILSNVKDPENRQLFEEETLTDYTNIGIKAGEEQKKARAGKNELDIKTYASEMRKKILASEDPERARQSVLQMIQDAPDLDQLQKTQLELELLPQLDADAVEVKANGLYAGGQGSANDKAAAVLRKFEGFRAKPYYDVNAYRVGYGSDTVTLADGSVVKVREGMTISKADAERDLKRRTGEFMAAAARDSGEAWNNLSPDQQAALTSVAYNYGSLPKRVVRAIQTGDAEAIANAVESLSDHNGGVNRKRREAEAALIRGSAAIPAGWSERPSLDDVISQVEQDPAYLRLGVDERDKVKASIVARYEKTAKEAEAAAKIDLQRDTVDYAVSQFEDPVEGEAYIKSTIPDPDTREDALTMFRKEQDQRAENKRRQNEQNVNAAWEGVTSALDAGDTATAQKIARTAEIPAKDRDALLERIDKGDARKDDPKVYDGILALKIGNETERRYFANVDGQGLNLSHLRHLLKPSTLETLAKEQETYRKQFEGNGKLPTYDSAGKMLDLKLQELGVDVSAKASTTDIGYRTAMRRIMSQNVEAAVKRVGRDLTPSEMEQVLDETFLQFRAEKAGGQSAFDYLMGRPSEKTYTVKDVLDEYTTIEADYGALPGEYLTRAQKAIAAKGLDVTPARLRGWLKAAINAGVIKRNNEAE